MKKYFLLISLLIGLNGAAQTEKIIDGLLSPIGIAFHNDKLFVVESIGEKVSYFYVDDKSSYHMMPSCH